MKPLKISLVLLVLFVGNVNAQVLYRCMSASGVVSWQSATCPQGMHTVKSVEYTPDAQTPSSLPSDSRATYIRTRSRASSGYRVSARTTRTKPDACARARGKREVTLERVGLKRNFDLLSKLDADVRSVCR